MKNFILIFLLVFSVSLFSDEFNRDVIVHNQSRNEKVVSVFNQMINAYKEEDIDAFFSYISEDRFTQDYITFREAIEKDFRVYDIIDIETWIDKIGEDGVKRYLYVRWHKVYESDQSSTQLERRGYSRFLFDEINGQYKLIEIAGNNLWGASLEEWKKEVPHIQGEESETSALPDLTIENAQVICNPNNYIDSVKFEIVNQGEENTNNGSIGYKVDFGGGSTVNGQYSGNIESSGRTSTITVIPSSTSILCAGSVAVQVDPNNEIEESDEDNNIKIINGGGGNPTYNNLGS